MSAGRVAKWFCALLCASLLLALTVPVAFAQQPAGVSSPIAIAPVEAAVCPASIGFGETIQCSILLPGEVDSYTFTAAPGDKVLVRASSDNGALWPGIRVNSSGGAMVCEIGSSGTAEIASCTLAAGGNYSILIFDDFDGILTGPYHLYLQRLNNPGNTVPITFGQTLAGSILTPAQMDTYTFTASPGDKVLVRASSDNGALWPGIRVYDASGVKVCEIGSSGTAEIASCTLAAGGNYSILIFDDFDGILTGPYHLYLQRLNNPGNIVPINFGQTLAGSILDPAEMDTYTFTASPGDKVLVRASSDNGALWPGIRVYDSGGTQVCQAGSSGTAEIASCTLAGGGTYSILVFDDFDGILTGPYHLYLQRLNNPGNTVPITFGQTLAGAILDPAEMDTYTFTANPGDKVLVRASSDNGALWPGILVYDSGGVQVCQAGSSGTAEIASCLLATGGTYSMLIFDHFDGILTGDYHLYLQRLNNPGNSVPITFGQTLAGAILDPAEMDTYTFTASPGDKVLVRASSDNGALWPGIRVYDAGGVKVCEIGSSGTAEIASCTLAAGGIYSILVFDDFDGILTGDYHLYMQRLNNPGNAVPILVGQSLTGSILTSAEMDAYTFTAGPGKVLVRMSKTSGSIWPGIRVYSPDGTRLCEDEELVTAEIPACNLPTGGTYTILAFDSFDGILTGSYRLCLNCSDFSSAGGLDGWILESGENSGKGGTLNAAATTFNLGDNAADRQYRSILSFDTSGLPDTAAITKVTLKIKRQGIVGTNPFNTHGGLKVDIRRPYFGTSAALAVSDFQAGASKLAIATFNKTPAAGGWYSAVLSSAAYPFIDRSGITQFRLRFAKDDNDDLSADYLKFYSGNAGAAYRPVLVIEYSIP